MKKILRALLIGMGILVGLFLIAAIAIPILFKGKIVTLARTQMNAHLNAKTSLKDIDLSLFSHFPYLTVELDSLTIINKEPFEGDTLIAAPKISISVNLLAAFMGKYEIRHIVIEHPRIHALVNEKGTANWSITLLDTSKPTTGGQPSKPFALKLSRYAMENAFIEYKDDQGKMHAILQNMTHSGSGDFTSDNFTLVTKTSIEALTYVYGNIPYLNKVQTTGDMDIQIDTKSSKYTFNTDNAHLNGLRLGFKGFVQMPDTTNINMDMTFNTPSNDFKDILSLVPGIYLNSFKDIKTSGKFTLNGFVKGTYNSKQMPAFDVNLSIIDGMFQYPSLPQKVSDIQVAMRASNPDGNLDNTTVNLDKMHLEMANQPFDMRMTLKKPLSNPWVDAALKGHIDLSQVVNFVKLDVGTKLSGVIDADMAYTGAISAASGGKYDQVNAKGEIAVKDLYYASKDYPEGINLYSLLLKFNPKNVNVSDMKTKYQGTTLEGSGSIDNLLGYYLHNEALTGILNVSADKADVNRLMGTSATPAPKTATTPASANSVFLVPANLNITLNSKVGMVKYDSLILTNLAGAIVVKDQTVFLKNLAANGLGGTIGMTGYYSTKLSKKNPDILFTYKLEKIDIQQAYTNLNTVKKLMPVAKFLTGTLNSDFNMDGKLGADMLPIMNSLSGKGNVTVLGGVLKQFPVMDELGNTLKIDQIKNLSLKDIHANFSFENGRVTVEPYTFKAAGINFEVAGSHGFDQTIKYGVNMAIPKSMMGSTAGGALDNLNKLASKNGIPVKTGDNINLSVKIGGTMSKPIITTGLKDVAGNAVADVKQQIKQEATKRIDSAKSTVKDSAKVVKTQVVNAAKQSLKNQLEGKPDSTKNNLDKTLKTGENTLKGLFKRK